MDPRYSAQDILLCDLCQRAALQSHCELCQINLCKACVEEHLSDSSIRHNVVPYKDRSCAPYFPEQLHQMFGSQSALSITTEEQGYAMMTLEAASFLQGINSWRVSSELITSIDTKYKYLHSVTCLSDEEIWTCGDKKIIRLYNLEGNLLKSISSWSGASPEDITVTRSGSLVYTDSSKRTINIVKDKQIQEIIILKGWKPYYICSTFAGDLLVTMLSDDSLQSKVVRYFGRIKPVKKQTIQFDSKGKPLYSSGYCAYISENRNLDICVADNAAGAVVVVNQAGELRFRYTGHPSTTKGSFRPHGITTDSQSQILTSDCDNNCIHILDQDGQFLSYIDDCEIQFPWGLCLDTKDNLFVTECYSGKIKKIKYKKKMC